MALPLPFEFSPAETAATHTPEGLIVLTDPRDARSRWRYRYDRYFFKTPAGEPRVMPQEFLTWNSQHLIEGRPDRWGYRPPPRWETRSWAWWDPNAAGGRGMWNTNAVQVRHVGADGARSWILPGMRLDGHYAADVPCNAKCLNATGPHCECSCGGANHGAGVSMRWIPAAMPSRRRA